MDHTKVLLLVDSDDENSIEIHDTLKDNGFNILAIINIKKNHDLSLLYQTFSVLVCQFRSVKSVYLQAISQLLQTTPRPVILFTKDDSRDSIDMSVKAGVNAYIIDGFNSERIKSIIEVAISRFNNYQQISKELDKTRQQLQDRKSIEKAKGMLMKTKRIDEQAAYTSIRKMAMDKSKSMGEISRSIIDVMDVMV